MNKTFTIMKAQFSPCMKPYLGHLNGFLRFSMRLLFVSFVLLMFYIIVYIFH